MRSRRKRLTAEDQSWEQADADLEKEADAIDKEDDSETGDKYDTSEDQNTKVSSDARIEAAKRLVKLAKEILKNS